MQGVLGGIQSAANTIGGMIGPGLGNFFGKGSGGGSSGGNTTNPTYNLQASQGSVAGPVNPSTGLSQPGQGTQVSTQTSGGNTSGGGNSGNTNPHINPATGQWDDNYFAQHNQSGGQGIDQGVLDQINQLYQGQSNYLNNLASNILPQSRDLNLASAQDYFNTQSGLLPGQQSQLLAPIGQNEQSFQGSQESAAASAQRAYQGLQQQAQAGYGAGSSAGGALGDLAAQQFALNQGQLQQQQGAGQLEFANEKSQVGQFIAQKGADLSNWLNEAKLQINQNFQAQISAVNQQQALTEDAKAQAKLGILQSTVEQNRAIELANQQFQNQLQLFQATQTQNSQNANSGYSTGQGLQNQRSYQMMNSQIPQVQPYNVGNLNQGGSAPALTGGTGTRPLDQFSLPGF